MMSGLFSKIIDNVDQVLIRMGETLKREFPAYCVLETADDKYSFVANDGSMVTLIRLDGSKSIVGNQSFYSKIVGAVEGSLSQPMQSKAHLVQFCFTMDQEKTEREIRTLLEPSKQTMLRLQLDMGDMLQERVENLKDWTTFESCFIALWTRPLSLTKEENKVEAKNKVKAMSTLKMPVDDGQNLYVAKFILRDRHRSFVSSVFDVLGNNAGLSAEKLDVYTAAREIRAMVDPQFTDDYWVPSLPGDRVYPQIKRGSYDGFKWDASWPKINGQLCPRDAEVVDKNVVRVGDKIYSPIYIDLFPRDPSNFLVLFGRLLSKQLPWRALFTIEGDGITALAFKKVVASILGFTNSKNKLLSTAIGDLQDYQQNHAETIVKVTACFCTWAKKDDEEELARRSSDLARALENWGGCDVSQVTGDPVAGLASTLPAFSYKSVGSPAAVPLREILSMMPLYRPASPWSQGAVTFRSPDGKLLAYQPGSKEQSTWISLIFAKPGSGKSVLMNLMSLGLCLSPGLKRLPRIAIVDIGPSSSGLISLIKEALPHDQRHLAAHYRMRMTRQFAVNPFDTQLGCRYPTALEKQFLINFVTLLVTDVNQELPFTGVTGLVQAVIDEMYLMTSDKEQPHIYTKDIEPSVDEAIVKSGMHLDRKTTWWEVVDHLFLNGFRHEAVIAQRHAVPLLSDAALAAQSEKIREIHGDIKFGETSENIIKGFNRMIGEALSFYPILARPTIFDIGDARVVALDLDEVAKTGGAMADRTTGVLYMLARYILAKDFYITVDSVADMPYPMTLEVPESVPVKAYKDYHTVRVQEIREDLKRICYDEFHRTSKSKTVREQIIVDMREGRKWGVDVTLASQALEDFDETMIKFATSIFVMDAGTESAIQEIADIFGFEDEGERVALKYGVHKPRAGGGTFLAKFDTKQGWYTMLLTSTLGPIELWAFSTSQVDVNIRNQLYVKLGPGIARKVLAYKYPDGSAEKEHDRRKVALRDSSTTMFNMEESNITEEMVKELIEVKELMVRRGLLRE